MKETHQQLPEPEVKSLAEPVCQPKPGRFRDAAMALSLANLCFIQAWSAMLFDSDHGYFNKVPVSAITLLALMLNITVVALVFWTVARLARRLDNGFFWGLLHIGLCVLLLIPLNFVRLNWIELGGGRLIALLRSPLAFVSGLVLLGAIVRWHRLAARAISMLLLVLAPLVLFTLGKVFLLLFHFQTLAQDPGGRAAPAPPLSQREQPRVIWIVFDELDQRIAFSERPAGVQLPELDRFVHDSFSATNAYPPGGTTMISIPALTTGRMVSGAVPSSPRELAVTWSDAKSPAGWSTQANVFSRARALGVNTAVVGWYHPYERLFGASLNYCSWYPYPPFEPARAWTFPATVLNQVWSTLLPLQLRRLHLRTYQNMLEDSLHIATNADFGLVLLHLPVPHFPAIYSAAARQFTITSFSRDGYLNNLALADRTFGALRRALEKSGSWEKTWLLLSSDHWWREAPAYDGKLDHRVPFVLKAPGTNRPVTYAAALGTIVTHDLLLAILRQELTDAGQIAPWLDQHRTEPPLEYRRQRMVRNAGR